MAGIGAATIYATSVSLSLLVLALYIIGAARYLTNLEENTCDMTYMFEYPQYVKISLKEEIEERYPRFGLYAYGEGFVTEKLRRMKFSGIPVLFVPGNAGSHEQVRSLASVSLRKTMKDRTSFHFDYFTISLGKDYSALYGGVLEDETTYVSLCISKVLSLYKGSLDQLVLIGHSMGGIVAKAALSRHSIASSSNVTSESERKSAASILLTLASPHRPIFLPDRTIARYYEEIERSSDNRLREMGTSVVSIAGGRRDLLVSSSQAIEPSADLNVVSSGVPTVWKSTDHLCILWCKQLVLTIVRALFDCVDVRARPQKITSDVGLKIGALSYHLTSRVSGKKAGGYENKIYFERGAEWIEDIRKRYTWSKKHDGFANKTVYLMIRVDETAIPYDSIAIETINLEARDWLFACSAYAIEGVSRVCEWGWNLTNRTSLLPDPIDRRTRKSVDIRLKDLRGWNVSHVIVGIPQEELRNNKKGNPVKIHVDLYKRSDRTFRFDKGSSMGTAAIFKLLPLGRIWSPDPQGVLTTEPGSLRYLDVLSGIEDALAIEIEPRLLETDDSFGQSSTFEIEPPQGIFELIEPCKFAAGHKSTSQVRTIVPDVKKDGTFARKRLVMYLAGKNENAALRITLEPEYSYQIVIRRAGIVDRIACSVRDRWPTVYSIVVSLCLLGIATRLDASPRTTTITAVLSLLGAAGLDFIFETLVAIGLLHVVAITTCFLEIFFGTIAHKVTARFLARIVSIPSLWFDWLLGGFDRLPILSALILLSLASATCGAIAILVSVPLYFLKLMKMYEEYLEELFMASLRHFIPRLGRERRKRKRRGGAGTGSTTTDVARPGNGNESPAASVSTPAKISRETLLNHLLLFVTWSFAAIPAIPSALVWAKNFRYETRLTTEDPTMLVSWLVLTCWRSVGLVELPTSDSSNNGGKRRTFCGTLIRIAAWSIAVTASLENSAYYQWIVPPVVAFAISCLALLSLFPGNPRSDNSRAIED